MSPDPPAPIPQGAVLLHIGPHKTGSSTLQHALADARPSLADHGVAYPPAEPDPDWPAFAHRAARPGWAVMGHTPRGMARPEMSVWDDFAAEVRAASAAGLRVCVSSETFCAADSADVVRKVVEDLGGDRVHLLVACRRLHRLLPSVWQQQAREGRERLSYAGFLKWHFRTSPAERRNTAVWRYQGMDHPLRTWLPTVAPERATVVVLADGDRDILTRTAEQLLGLPSGMLTGAPDSNASLPYERVDLLRRLNGAAVDRGWRHRDYVRLMHRAVMEPMGQVPVQQSESSIPALPGWMRELIPELERERVDAIDRSGSRVVGDVDSLLAPVPEAAADTVPRAESVPVQVAVGALAELAERVLLARGRADRHRDELRELRRRIRADGPLLAAVSSRELLAELVRRQRRRLRRR